MNIDNINGYLESVEILNAGSNFNPDFYIEEMEKLSGLEISINNHYLKAIIERAKYNNSDVFKEAQTIDIRFPERCENWNLTITENIGLDKFKEKLKWYFFEQPYSPKLNDESSSDIDNIIYFFIRKLTEQDSKELTAIHHVDAYYNLMSWGVPNDSFVLEVDGRLYYLWLAIYT